MKRMYSCLKCKATLNPNVKLILTMAKDRRRSLILLSPQPGNYSVIVPDGEANFFGAGREKE